jgi:hypothetical protein
MDDLNTLSPTQSQTPTAASTAGAPDGTGTEPSDVIPGPSLLVWEPGTPSSKARPESLRHAHAHVTWRKCGTYVTIHPNNKRSKATGNSQRYPVGTRVRVRDGDRGPYEDDGTVYEGLIEKEEHEHASASDCRDSPSCAKMTTTYMPLYLAPPDPDSNARQRQQRETDMTVAADFLRDSMMRCSTHNDVE